MTIRVVQWTTGNVGKQSVEAVMKRPDLELVGCYAWSEDKSGKDIGELCGFRRSASRRRMTLTRCSPSSRTASFTTQCGSTSTRWSAFLSLVPTSSPRQRSSTARRIPTTGESEILDACAKGGSSMFGSGVSPGYIELVAVALANASDRIDAVLISEEADTTAYDSPPTEIPVGFGRPLDDPELPGMTAAATVVFSEAVALVGDALGVVFDEIVCEAEYAKTTKDLDLGSWTLAKDTVAGVTIHWLGKIGGRNIVEMRVRWRKGDALEPDWQVGMGWTIEIAGSAHHHHEDRHPAAAVLRGDDHGGVHGAWAHHHGSAGHQRHPRRCGRTPRDHHLRGHPAPTAQGLRPDLTDDNAPAAAGRWRGGTLAEWAKLPDSTLLRDQGDRAADSVSPCHRIHGCRYLLKIDDVSYDRPDPFRTYEREDLVHDP